MFQWNDKMKLLEFFPLKLERNNSPTSHAPKSMCSHETVAFIYFLDAIAELVQEILEGKISLEGKNKSINICNLYTG